MSFADLMRVSTRPLARAIRAFQLQHAEQAIVRDIELIRRERAAGLEVERVLIRELMNVRAERRGL